MAWAVAIRKSPTELVQPGVDDPPHVFGARSWKFQFPSESSLRLPPFCPLGRRGRSRRRGKGRRRRWTVEPGLPAVLFGTTRHLPQLPWLAFSTPFSITRPHLFTCLCRTALAAEIHRDPPVAVAFRRNHRPRPPPSLQSAILLLRPPRGLPPVRFRPLRCLPRQSPRASDLGPAPAPPGPFHCR